MLRRLGASTGRASQDPTMNRLFVSAMALGWLPAVALAQAPPAAGGSSAAFSNPIPNIPGKSLQAVVVTYPPGAKNPPHHHASSAFITAYVLEGAVVSQVDGGPAKTYRVGESFTEQPGAHHQVSANASATEPARMLAIFVLDTGETPLSIPDK
jgi:quercetin dioxygenase-like cupin family protein